MTRPSPSQARAFWIAIATTLTATLITAASRQYSSSKLDVARFERDSINRDYRALIDHSLLLRIDSTTRRIESVESRAHGR